MSAVDDYLLFNELVSFFFVEEDSTIKLKILDMYNGGNPLGLFHGHSVPPPIRKKTTPTFPNLETSSHAYSIQQTPQLIDSPSCKAGGLTHSTAGPCTQKKIETVTEVPLPVPPFVCGHDLVNSPI